MRQLFAYPLVLLLILLAPGQAAPAYGQVKLEGRVIDNDTEAPITGASVTISAPDGDVIGQVVTDNAGVFRFALQEHGGIQLQAMRLGYQHNITPVLWTDGHDSINVEIRLDPEAILIAPLEVTAWSRRVQPSPVLADFRHRQELGLGHFITREDIERIQPVLVTDLLARVPGVTLASNGSGLRRGVFMSRAIRAVGRSCPAQVFVDGMLLNTGGGPAIVDDAVTPGGVEGIEVYNGLGTVPAPFLNPDSRCGVIAIWTRRGG